MTFLQNPQLDLHLSNLTMLWYEPAPLIQFSILALATVTIYWIGKIVYRLTLHPLAKVPGPKLHAAFQFPFLYQSYIEATAPRKIETMHREYGPVVRVSPNQIAVDGVIGWPEAFAHTSKNKPEFPKPMGNYFPGDVNSLIGAPKERHRRIRRQLAHAFSDSALAERETTLLQYTGMLLDRFSELEKLGMPFNIVHWLNYTSFDIIGELAFSDSFDSLANNGYHPWVLSIFQGIRGNALRRFLRHYPLLQFAATSFGLTNEIKISDANRLAAREKAARRMQKGVVSADFKQDFMTFMLRKTRAGETALNEEEILSTSPILVVAGSETVATALSGLFFFLSQNSDKSTNLVAEILGAYSSDSEITMRNTAQLEYLHATLEETLRLYPPVLVTPARLSPGYELGGYYIPQGTWVSVNQLATFRNPDHFFLPEEFIPERWLQPSHPRYDIRFANDNKAVFKPFSHGSRDCIGKNLAYAEMRLLATRILHRFDVTVQGQSDWLSKQRTFTLWEKGPLDVQLKAR